MGYASRSNPQAVAAKNGEIQPKKPGKSKRRIERELRAQIEHELRAQMAKAIVEKNPGIAGTLAAMSVKPY